MDEADVRLEALRLAVQRATSDPNVIQNATIYAAFIRGEYEAKAAVKEPEVREHEEKRIMPIKKKA